jgi:hypothetical protein
MNAVLVAGHDADGCLEVELGYVVDPVGFGPIASHVVNDPGGGDHETVAALFDPLHVPDRGMVCDSDPVHGCRDDLPHPSQVRCALDQRLAAPGEDWRRHFSLPSSGRGVRHRDVGDLLGFHGR